MSQYKIMDAEVDAQWAKQDAEREAKKKAEDDGAWEALPYAVLSEISPFVKLVGGVVIIFLAVLAVISAIGLPIEAVGRMINSW